MQERSAESGEGLGVAEIGSIYARAAAVDFSSRNPIVFIPGILGSRLVDSESARSVWGDFGRIYADPARLENRRLLALPMAAGATLDQLASPSEADGTVRDARLRHLPITVGAYRDILHSVGIGPEPMSAKHRPHYAGGGTFASFEFGYDWRRSLDEIAQRLDEYLRMATHFVQSVRGNSDPVKFDVVAHSMGGLVLRYYLRYGAQLLPADHVLPRLTWGGSERVARAIIIGTPNAGSIMALNRLVCGMRAKRLVHPGYDPIIIGTMPALYQLLPRSRHCPFVDEAGDEIADLFDPEFWSEMGWGLADESSDHLLAMQLEGVDTPAKRRDVALDHMAKCLGTAKAFHASLDRPAPAPPGLELHLVAGDAHKTPAVASSRRGERQVKIVRHEAGDGTVLRSSALLDERSADGWTTGVKSPISWSSIVFAASDHMALTRDRVVVNNVLFKLLDTPRH